MPKVTALNSFDKKVVNLNIMTDAWDWTAQTTYSAYRGGVDAANAAGDAIVSGAKTAGNAIVDGAKTAGNEIGRAHV